VKILAEVLGEESCKLEHLDLGSLLIGEEGIKAIAGALNSGKSSLKSLVIRTSSITAAGTLHLARALGHLNPCNCALLSILDLSSNNLGDDGVSHIGEALKSLDCPLQSLYLDRNRVTAAGAFMLASAIEVSARLRLLSLSCNNVGGSGAVSLISSSRVLTRLFLSSTNISRESSTAVCTAIRDSPSLQLVSLTLNDIQCHDSLELELRQRILMDPTSMFDLPYGAGDTPAIVPQSI